MEKRKYICQNIPYFQYRTNDTIYEVTLSHTPKGKVAEYLYDAYVEDGVLYIEAIKTDVFNEFFSEHSKFTICKKEVCFFTNSFCVNVIP